MRPNDADQPWRVAEFWSSADPRRKVLMIAVGNAEIEAWGKRGDFVRWMGPCLPQASAQPEAKAAPAQADERDALADLRKAVQDGVSDEWLLGFVRQYPFPAASAMDGPALNPLAEALKFQHHKAAPAMGEELPPPAAWRYQPKDGLKHPAYTEREAQALAYDAQPVALFTADQLRACMALRHPGAEHPDDSAVDRFAAAMKGKMAASRAKGRGGWDDPEQCPANRLRAMMRAHIGKGDPVDVGNFCMMLWNRNETTAMQTDLTGTNLFANNGQEPDWTAYEAAEAAAPAMGEELPLSDEDAKIIATFERHIDKDLDTSPGVTSYWIKQSEVVEAVRACMALRQPGAVARKVIPHEDIEDGELASWSHAEKHAAIGWNDCLDAIAATAPVSQPAAQEPIYSYCMKLVDGTYDNWRDCSREHFEHVQKWPGNGFKVRTLYTAPQPLSAPAGSEQYLAVKRQARNQVTIDGHLNAALDAIMRSDSPDGKFCILGALVDQAIDAALAAQQEQGK
jgi:hypothetical protein